MIGTPTDGGLTDTVPRKTHTETQDDLRERTARSAEPAVPSLAPDASARDTEPTPSQDPAATQSIVHSIRYLLRTEFGEDLEGPDLGDPMLSYRVERRAQELLGDESVALSAQQREVVVGDVVDDLLGMGPLQPLLDDPTVTEIMVNGPRRVFIERSGAYLPARRVFYDDEHLSEVIDRLLSRAGRRADASSPVIEQRMPDGSRINLVMPPLAIDGPALTIRKFPHDHFGVEDLISFGTLDERTADFLRACVRARLSVLVSGATGSGRTTLLNILGSWIPDEERIVTVEDAAELHLPQSQVVRLETRAPDVAGQGGVGLRELVRTGLRMHADRIAVGEIVGEEAFEVLMAIGAGHDGWLATIHAGSPSDALLRFESLALLGAGPQAPAHAIRSQVSSAFDVVVHLVRLRDGTRRVMHIAEVGDPTADGIAVRDLFEFDASRGLDSTGRLRGRIVPTGLLPVFSDRLAEVGGTSRQLGLDEI